MFDFTWKQKEKQIKENCISWNVISQILNMHNTDVQGYRWKQKKFRLLFDSFMKLIIHFSAPSILPAEPVSCLSELWDSLIIASQLQLFPAVLENQLIMIPVVPV